MPDSPINIIVASSTELIAEIRELFVEYAHAVGEGFCFVGFKAEIDGLPGAYAPPAGRLLLARAADRSAGCIAFRPLAPCVCEMKRLYVRPEFRATGLGRRLATHLIQSAAAAGYRTMRLDTLPKMTAAIALYRSLGFRDIPPYYDHPIGHALHMELTLASPL